MEAEQTERGVVLTLSDVLFDTNEAQLREGAMRAMDRLTEYMNGNPRRELLIEGHTDARAFDERRGFFKTASNSPAIWA